MRPLTLPSIYLQARRALTPNPKDHDTTRRHGTNYLPTKTGDGPADGPRRDQLVRDATAGDPYEYQTQQTSRGAGEEEKSSEEPVCFPPLRNRYHVHAAAYPAGTAVRGRQRRKTPKIWQRTGTV
jgi:hypothetical protein